MWRPEASIPGELSEFLFFILHHSSHRRVLPVVLDVGTNNEKLLADPRYLGIKESRMEGEEYYALIDEFMAAVKLRWPRALVQFEDFQSKYAIKLLQRFL